MTTAIDIDTARAAAVASVNFGMSPEIDKIVPALIKAQGEFPVVPTTKINPHFKNKYAPLPEIMKACQPVLAKHGLAIIHITQEAADDDGWVMRTHLLHTSGQWICASLPIKGSTPQALGSEITYMRRYTAGCVLGIVSDEDDDAEVANKKAPVAAKKKAPAKKANGSRAGDGTPAMSNSLKNLWPLVYQAADKMGLSKEEGTDWFRNRLREWENLESTKDLNQKQANNIMTRLAKVIELNTPPAEES